MRIIHNGKLMSSYIISLIDLIWYDKKKDVFFQLHSDDVAILFCVRLLMKRWPEFIQYKYFELSYWPVNDI